MNTTPNRASILDAILCEEFRSAIKGLTWLGSREYEQCR